MSQVAVFVVRYYGGVHLQKKRFTIILDLAAIAIDNMQIQGTTSRLQLNQLKTPLKTKRPAKQATLHPMKGITKGGLKSYRGAHSGTRYQAVMQSYIKRNTNIPLIPTLTSCFNPLPLLPLKQKLWKTLVAMRIPAKQVTL